MFDVLVLLAPFIGAGLFLVWWRRRRAAQAALAGSSKDEAPIDLTLLLDSPRILTSEHLISAIREALGREIKEGEEGAEEFVVAEGPFGLVQIEGYSIPFICSPEPMVEDPAKASEGISELRMRTAFASHRAYIQFGCAYRNPGTSRADAYARLGRLVAALVDETTLLIYCPETRTGSLMNPETLEALRSGDPLSAMRTLTFDAIGMVADDDPQMRLASEEARRRFGEFVSAFEQAQDREAFLIKAPFTDGTNTEFMWVAVKQIEEQTIHGVLVNAPFNVRRLREGSEVTVPRDEIVDWGYPGESGLIGLFTEQIVRGSLK